MADNFENILLGEMLFLIFVSLQPTLLDYTRVSIIEFSSRCFQDVT